MLSTKVIATHITNLTDARYFAAWGVDYLAYIVEEGREESIHLSALQEIDQWVEGPESLLMYEGLSVDATSTIFQEAGYKKAILGPFIEPDSAWDATFRIITALDRSLCSEPGSYIFRPENNDVPSEWDAPEDVHIYIDVDQSPQELKSISQYPYVAGIVVRGSQEQKVGVKTYDELTDLFESLEVFE